MDKESPEYIGSEEKVIRFGHAKKSTALTSAGEWLRTNKSQGRGPVAVGIGIKEEKGCSSGRSNMGKRDDAGAAIHSTARHNKTPSGDCSLRDEPGGKEPFWSSVIRRQISCTPRSLGGGHEKALKKRTISGGLSGRSCQDQRLYFLEEKSEDRPEPLGRGGGVLSYLNTRATCVPGNSSLRKEMIRPELRKSIQRLKIKKRRAKEEGGEKQAGESELTSIDGPRLENSKQGKEDQSIIIGRPTPDYYVSGGRNI